MVKRPWYVQCVRGCKTLPHVGEHPGTAWVFFMILACGIAGIERGGFKGFIGGASLAAFFMLPLYLYGAYDRANISDRRTTTGARDERGI